MLILLDIDGVMVPANSWRMPEILDDGFPVFERRSVLALEKIIFETNAGILLTTSHKSSYSIDQWRDIFKTRGIFVNQIDRLGDNIAGLNRGEEILAWYKTTMGFHKDFVIIDDDKSLNTLPKDIKDRFVLTSGSVGLTDELADRAISILKTGALRSE
jgi:hypothetical protein